MSSNILWKPDSEWLERANLTAFIAALGETERIAEAITIEHYDALHRWSIAEPARFWNAVWDFCGVIGDKGESLLINADQMPGAQFFPDAQLNFAENLLRRNDADDAIVFWCEDRIKRRLSWAELNQQVSRLAQALEAEGINPGDRIAALMPNMPETVIGMLACASLGAVWCSCSPDFGEQGVLDRFGQIEPKLLLACDGYFYKGQGVDILPKLEVVADQLPSLERIVLVPYLRGNIDQEPVEKGRLHKGVFYQDFVASYEAGPIQYRRLPFNHPLYILFSSGTTGEPKCIVHGAGGTLIQHLKEHQLHCDIKPNDRVFYYTTCTWMMWNWLVSALASEAKLLLYDGSPFYPKADILFDYADAEDMTLFGTAAKYIDALKRRDINPESSHRLDSLRMMTSTGSPLAPESFDFVYQQIKEDLYLASISGGTDIVSCFVLGNPLAPVRRGEIACRGLGMAVETRNEHGESVVGEKGELVCAQPFPSMPICFWNDADNQKYQSAYFESRPGLWSHGDFAELTDCGGVIIHGRSDAVLNPGGVRIGTAEIYRQVEQFDEVLESIAVGQDWQGDVRIVLFVILREGLHLDEALINRIKQRTAENASPRHVPTKVIQVKDIPRTKSGKITEVAVRDVIAGRTVKNRGALANPDALDSYRGLLELQC